MILKNKHRMFDRNGRVSADGDLKKQFVCIHGFRNLELKILNAPIRARNVTVQ